MVFSTNWGHDESNLQVHQVTLRMKAGSELTDTMKTDFGRALGILGVSVEHGSYEVGQDIEECEVSGTLVGVLGERAAVLSRIFAETYEVKMRHDNVIELVA